jgi:chemotaxis signal transduction protein
MAEKTSSLKFASPLVVAKIELLILEITIATRQYAIRAASVKKLLPMAAWAVRPELPEHVVGVLGFEGQSLPVVDARVCLGFESQLPKVEDHLLLVQANSLFFIWIDRANEVRGWHENDKLLNLEVFDPMVDL